MNNIPATTIRRSWVVLDLESAVSDEAGHKRYQRMERWKPSPGKVSRRGYKRSEDPCITPRWPFQTIVAAAIMVLQEHVDGNIDVIEFTTLSAPALNERGVVQGLIDVLASAPAGAELASWAGMLHDVPLLMVAAQRHGLTLPPGWRWLGFGGNDTVRHIDFARTTTGGFKMKPVHLAEILATLDIPAKITVPAFAVARLIYREEWEGVVEAVEMDVISTALLLAHWRRLFDPRAEVDVVKDRILRRVEELRPDRHYLGELKSCRAKLFASQLQKAKGKISVLAPWLEGG